MDETVVAATDLHARARGGRTAAEGTYTAANSRAEWTFGGAMRLDYLIGIEAVALAGQEAVVRFAPVYARGIHVLDGAGELSDHWPLLADLALVADR